MNTNERSSELSITGPEEAWVADVCEVTIGEGNKEDNASLICAAPDLLEAAKLALAKCPFPVGAMRAKEALQQAVARAEGMRCHGCEPEGSPDKPFYLCPKCQVNR